MLNIEIDTITSITLYIYGNFFFFKERVRVLHVLAFLLLHNATENKPKKHTKME